MRIIYLLHLLIIVFCTFTYTIERDVGINYLNNAKITDIEKVNTPNLKKVTFSCQYFIEKFNICFQDKDLSSKDICDNYYTDECQALLIQNKNICDGIKYKLLHEYNVLIMKFACAKNEKGDFCPQYQFFIGNDLNRNITDVQIQEVCKSKICTENSLEFFNNYKNFFINAINSNPTTKHEILVFIDKALNILNGDNCKVNTSSFVLIGGIIFGCIVVILIGILVAFMLIKKSSKNDNNIIENDINLEENESDTSSGRVVFLNQPQFPNINVMNNQNNNDMENPPPSYDNSNMVMTTNNNKPILHSLFVDEDKELPPEYTEIN